MCLLAEVIEDYSIFEEAELCIGKTTGLVLLPKDFFE